VSEVVIYHPGTEATAAVDAGAVPHYRRSGWLLLSEHQENEGARAKAAAKSAGAAAKTGSEEK
jgi:hypothetical protein